jgi:hypothetical protein
MEKILTFIKFALKNKYRWLVPAIAILIVFIFINYFLSNEGFRPFGYRIF